MAISRPSHVDFLGVILFFIIMPFEPDHAKLVEYFIFRFRFSVEKGFSFDFLEFFHCFPPYRGLPQCFPLFLDFPLGQGQLVLTGQAFFAKFMQKI